jgi:hypothetical protein
MIFGKDDEEQGFTVTGDCLNVMRMADVLAANMQPLVTDQSAASSAAPSPSASAAPLSSFTVLPWAPDSVLAREFPSLVPFDTRTVPPCHDIHNEYTRAMGHSWNRVESTYNMHDHCIGAVTYPSLTFGLIDLSLSSSTPSLRDAEWWGASPSRGSVRCVPLLGLFVGR